MGTLQYSQVRPAVVQSDLTTIAPYMFWLMFRNVASDGLVFEDPVNTGVLSQPGCVLASPHTCPPSAPGPPSERSALMSGARPLMMVCRPKS